MMQILRPLLFAAAAVAYAGPDDVPAMAPIPFGALALVLAGRDKWRPITDLIAAASAIAIVAMGDQPLAQAEAVVALLALGTALLLPSVGAPASGLASLPVLALAAAGVFLAIWQPAQDPHGPVSLVDPTTAAGLFIRAWATIAVLAAAVLAWTGILRLVRRKPKPAHAADAARTIHGIETGSDA